jgi:L-seryl-tRNA(Ser) seleniumtransferase
MDKKLLYRSIPKVDVILEDAEVIKLIERAGREIVLHAVHIELDRLRQKIASCENEKQVQQETELIKENIKKTVAGLQAPNMRSVINATGTILHTNLGRAPISEKHMEQIAKIATGYSNLEYNLEAGKRGERYSHFEELLCEITGAEAAMAVNNNAAAVMLVLSSLAKGGEVIVSRGELVEIGGKFRIPDVMKISGATLVEVGTTNKTHYSDYEEAITEETKALLKVHTSNYRIVGFTESVSIDELIGLAGDCDIPIIEDLGSGVLIDLEKYGLSHEPTVQESISKGADVVCFSGDKLLGGPQAGIIIGRKKYIDRMKKNQLTRALRIDKFTATALELVLKEYQSKEEAVKNIPVLRMITKPLEEVKVGAEKLAELISKSGLSAQVELCPCESQIGGGSLPLERIKSMAVSIRPSKMSVTEMEERMRKLTVPIIPRIADDAILLDVRTIKEDRFELIAKELGELAS